MREAWHESALGNVASVNATDPPLSADAPFVPMDAVEPGLRWPTYFTSRGDRGGARARAGDTLFARITPCLENGKVAQVPSNVERCGGSTEFIALRAGPQLLPDFLYIWATASSTRRAAAALMTGTTGRQRLSPHDMAALPITLLSLVEQRRIVDLVATFDRVRASRQVAHAYETAAGAMMGEVTASAMGWTSLASVVSKARAGGTPLRQVSAFFGGPIPWLKSGEVEADQINHVSESLTEQGLASSSAWIMPSGSIVVAMYGQGMTAGSVGYIAVPMAANQAVLGLVPDPGRVDPRFLFHWLRSRKESLRERRSGSSQPNLNKETVLQEPVPIVELDRQRIVAGVLDALSETSRRNTAMAAATERARAAVVTDLLAGDHEIPASYDRLFEGAA